MTTPISLAVVSPITLTDTMLISTNVPETDHAAWAVGTTYALGARVILISTHKVYESLQAGNVGKNPATQPAWWIEVKPTNRWAAFDTSNSSQTVTPGGATPKITYDIKPGQAISAVSVLNISNATGLTITLTDPVYGVVYSKTVDMTAVQPEADWWSWFFDTRVEPTQFVATDLPSFPNATLKVDLTGISTLAVGVILFGQVRRFGLGVQTGARVGITDYSRKETNEYGDTVVVQRAYAKRASFNTPIEWSEVDAMQAFLSSIRTTPCLWVASTRYESTTVFGFYKSFETLISYAMYADCNLEIEGLT
jgi:hypothetical protein